MWNTDDRAERLGRIGPHCLAIFLASADLFWSLTHLNIGLVDFHGLAAFTRGFVENGAWPATPYFPAGYPLLLAPFGWLGEALHLHGVLIGGYILTAVGAYLLMIAAHKIADHWGVRGAPGYLVLLLAFLAPEFRVAVGAPTPDMLASGLALCLIALGIKAWDEAGRELDAGWSAWLAGLATAIRYHMLLVAVPLGIALACRQHSRRIGFLTIAGALLAMLINHGVYFADFGALPVSVFMVQVRTGLEIQYRKVYPTPEELFDGYEGFAAHARSVPLLTDYSIGELVRHVTTCWGHYLRRPSVALALGLCLILLGFRRRLEPSMAIAALWLVCYTLALSSAYYTPRAAVLSCAMGIALSLGASRSLFPKPQAGTTVIASLLLCGFALSSRFARADFAGRKQLAEVNRIVAAVAEKEGLDPAHVATTRDGVFPLRDNPWCTPYLGMSGIWMQDPFIRPEQIPGQKRLAFSEVVSGYAGVDAVITFGTGRQESDWVEQAPARWKKSHDIMGTGGIWVPLP